MRVCVRTVVVVSSSKLRRTAKLSNFECKLLMFLYMLTICSSSVRVVSSARAGMGKSFYIHNMANELSKMQHMSAVTVTVPIHGPKLSVEALVDKLEDYMDNPHCVIHLDIASTVSRKSIRNIMHKYVFCHNTYQVLWQLDTTLFSMMLQGGLSDSQGRVWRRHPSQMYAIEVTQTAKEVPQTLIYKRY